MILPQSRILTALAILGPRVGAGVRSGGRVAVARVRDLAGRSRVLLEQALRTHKAPETEANGIVYPPPARAPSGRRVYAIGDIHGRADLLIRLLALVRQDASSGAFTGRPILVFLGDYIDRGFQSRDVINILLSDAVSPFETYFLKGNHEASMLHFLNDPSVGPRWAEFGGAATLMSYGVQPPRMRTSPGEWMRASAALRKALPPAHLHFLAGLKLTVRLGDYVFVHAGIRPGVGLEQQTEDDMLWIRDDFLSDRRRLGAVIVHGHTPLRAPHRDHRRVGIDTGAYLSGRLTAARFEHETVEFIATEPVIVPIPS